MSATPAPAPPPSGPIPVAPYVRMSTEHQQYSTQNQLDVIKEYAARRNMTIIEVFGDDGRSGLSAQHRADLRRMIAEAEAGKAAFRAILVYDVSRWGHFQDCDESGFYEYKCRSAGIPVHYCAEQFENDGSPTSNIIKAVKRSMAGEYTYHLLDGHMRLKALRELGKTEAYCLVAKDDDAFTYNDKVNRLSLIQEHAMIMRAIQNGVTAEQIAKALAVDVAKIKASMNLLDGIHMDAVELLKDKPITANALRLFRKAKAVWQIDMAQLMVSANNYTKAYAEALIVGSRPEQLVDAKKPKVPGISLEDSLRWHAVVRIVAEGAADIIGRGRGGHAGS